MWKIWLCHAKDFQSLMHPCFIFSRILGIFPNKINASIFKPSKQRYILSIVLICIIFICNLLIIHEILISKKIDFGEFSESLGATSYYACSGFIAIIAHILTGPRTRLLQIILKISSQVPPESYRKLSKLIHVKDIFYTLLLIINVFAYYPKENKYFGIYIFTVYIGQIVLQMDMQYMNYVCVIKACFKKINDDLIHTQKVIVNDELYAPTVICDMQKNQLLLTKLKVLKKQHLIISSAVHMLNIIFSLHLLATTTMIFTTAIFELYSTVVQWKNGLTIIWDANNIPFIISRITCETCKKQAFEIGTTIHDILNCTDKNENIKEELQLFSLQLLHQNNIFSAKGIIVDATLFTAMIGGITTYMLILVQFMIISHTCDKTFSSNITQTKLNPM
ncbi:hypothetical protein P5V15_009566 [Pogonomyrmex californicus]